MDQVWRLENTRELIPPRVNRKFKFKNPQSSWLCKFSKNPFTPWGTQVFAITRLPAPNAVPINQNHTKDKKRQIRVPELIISTKTLMEQLRICMQRVIKNFSTTPKTHWKRDLRNPATTWPKVPHLKLLRERGTFIACRCAIRSYFNLLDSAAAALM